MSTEAVDVPRSSLEPAPFAGIYEVDPGAVAAFRRDGHVLLRDVADGDDLETIRPAIVAASKKVADNMGPIGARHTYGQAFVQSLNLWRRDEAVARFTLAERFGRIAAELMGVDGVRLYHDQSLYKEPGGGRTPWHQDQCFWPFDDAKCVTMWLALSELDAATGPMVFASGSSRLGYLGPPDVTARTEPETIDMIRREGFTVSKPTSMRAGDATFHDGWVLHSAPANPTESPREAMAVIYVEQDAVVTEPDSPFRRLDLDLWLPGQEPGQLVGSDINPVVWSR